MFRDPMRKLLKEGVVTRMGNKITASSWIILTTDKLLYANKTIYGWKYKNEIPLSTLWIRDIEKSQKNQFLFQIISTNKVFEYSVTSVEEKEQWMTSINQAIKSLIKNSVAEKKKRKTTVLNLSKINKNFISTGLKKNSQSEVIQIQDPRSVRSEIFNSEEISMNPIPTISPRGSHGALGGQKKPPLPNKKPSLPLHSRSHPQVHEDHNEISKFETKNLIRFKGEDWVSLTFR